MRQLIAFTKKEYLELTRTGKLFILMILFILFGIMNPAIAKLTPWLMDTMSESLSEAGLTVTQMEADAMASWTQFYKNIPVALIIFLLMFSGVLTAEYQKGTLINMVTKGMDRWKVILSKIIVMTMVWTAGYWLCYGITYGYNAYFWDNHIASHLFFSAACFYLIGIWMISLILLMSACFQTNSAVLISAGGVFLIVYLLGLLPEIKKYLPVQLMDSSNLLTSGGNVEDYVWAVSVTIVLSVLNVIIAIVLFNKREI